MGVNLGEEERSFSLQNQQKNEPTQARMDRNSSTDLYPGIQRVADISYISLAFHCVSIDVLR